MTGTNALFLLVAIIALVVAAGALEASITALLVLMQTLLGAVLANVGRLLLLGACLVCLFLLLFYASPPPSGPGIG